MPGNTRQGGHGERSRDCSDARHHPTCDQRGFGPDLRAPLLGAEGHARVDDFVAAVPRYILWGVAACYNQVELELT